MLDCCVPTEIVRKQGITMNQFICIACCNYLDVESSYHGDEISEEEFRQVVEDVTTKDDRFMVVSYSRSALYQTGDGHFAPVSGYHVECDLVLILDTARFKYPPHWVPLPLLLQSMKAIDCATGDAFAFIYNFSHYY